MMEDSIDSSLFDGNNSLVNTTFERATLTRRSVSYNRSSRPSSERENAWASQSESKQNLENASFWILVVTLILVAAGNLSLTFFAMGVLRLGTGMESIEFLPDLKATKFFGITDLGNILQRDGIISGFADVPFSIIGNKDKVSFSLRTRSLPPTLEIGPDGIEVSNVKEFKVVDPSSGNNIFSTEYPNFGVPRGVRNLNVKKSSTSRVISRTFSDLDVRADSTIRLKGNEGLRLEGKRINWAADQDIYLKSLNGSMVLSAGAGLFVEVNTLPLAGPKEMENGRGQYKLCICLPKGQLFRVPIPTDNNKRSKKNKINCSSFSSPCRNVA